MSYDRSELGKFQARIYRRYISQHLPQDGEVLSGLTDRLSLWKHHFAHYLPIDRTAPILDIGCGYGEFLYFLRQQGYKDVVGVDASSEQMRLAQHLQVAQCIRLGDLREFLSQNTDAYEMIVANDVLEHFAKPDLLLLLDLVRSSLRSEGRFLLHVPNVLTLVPLDAYDDITHETVFTSNSLRQLLEAAGFERISIFPFTPLFSGPRGFLHWVRWHTTQSLLKMQVAGFYSVRRTISTILTPSMGAYCVRGR